VITEDSKISFYNDECFNIIKDNEGNVSIDRFECIKEENSLKTVKDYMLNKEDLEQATTKKFILEKDSNHKFYYTIRYSNMNFQEANATIILLEDQTSYEALKTLDDKYKRLYLASIVHDIRTPINGILGMLEAIEPYAHEEDVKTYINVARNSAYLLLFYTFDITDYSQIEANTITINKKLGNPSDIVKECMMLLDFNFKRKGVRLHKAVDPNVPLLIFFDQHRYKQILLNLLGNALKFTFKGRVKISLKYNQHENLLLTSVQDSGIGIKPEDIPKLFKFFGKVGDNCELNPTGVGMGLAICKKLAECMGGSITVNSIYGQGTTFTFSVKGEKAINASFNSFGDIPEEIEYIPQIDGHYFELLVHDRPLFTRSNSYQVYF